MDKPDDATAQRLTDLEVKSSYTDELLDQLNQTVFRQQQQIDILVRELKELWRQKEEAGAGQPRQLRDDLPPHY